MDDANQKEKAIKIFNKIVKSNKKEIKQCENLLSLNNLELGADEKHPANNENENVWFYALKFLNTLKKRNINSNSNFS